MISNIVKPTNNSIKNSSIECLEALVNPLKAREFLSSVWPDNLHFSRQGGAKLRELINQPEFESLQSIIKMPFDGLCRAHFNQHDITPKKSLTAEQLIKAYELFNATIYLQKLQTAIIKSWNTSLDYALNLDPGTARMECFISPKGKGLGWHYDDHEIFIVLVRGKKIWHLAKNTWPKAIDLNHDRLLERKKWAECDKSSIPKPTEYQTVEMIPGSVLYLPYGHWHSVENIEDSLHLVLNVSRSFILTGTQP